MLYLHLDLLTRKVSPTLYTIYCRVTLLRPPPLSSFHVFVSTLYIDRDLWLTKLPLCKQPLASMDCRARVLCMQCYVITVFRCINKDSKGSCGATGNVLMQCMAAVLALSMPRTSSVVNGRVYASTMKTLPTNSLLTSVGCSTARTNKVSPYLKRGAPCCLAAHNGS